MGLNDKLKGSYYKNYEATLASRTSIHNILEELKTYYNNLIDLIQNTYDKITVNRTEMIEKLNAILVKINYIEYSLNNFQLEIDSSIEEKLKKLMENYDNDFVTFMELYDTNLYNHSKLTDKASSNIVNYTQPLSEYEKSVEKLNTDIGVRWFGGKFNDKYLLNKLNGLLHIVKSNKYEGLSLEDYINSNLILDIFIYSTKGITWLKLGKNSTFGYNIQVKYHSLKYSGINIKLESNSYYTPRDYDINEFDLNILINFGYKEEDLKNGNVYIKVKTNLPSNTFSGLDEYYISGSTSINEYNDNRVIKNLGRRHVAHNNRDYGYNIDDTIKTLDELRQNNKKYDRETDYISDFVTDKYSKQNRVTNNNFEIYTEISPVNEYGNEQNIIRGTTKRITDDKEIVGIDNSISPIIVNCDKINKVNYDKTYLDDSDKLMNKEDEKENILYNENKQRVDLLDYRNVGEDIGLIAKNENTFVINNSVNDNNSVTINGNANLIKEAKNPAILNEITNNAILDINSDNSFTEEAFKVDDSSALFGPGVQDWTVIKQEKDPYGNIVVLAKNVTKNQNDYFTRISKIKNINEIYSMDYNKYHVYDFLFLENGNMYLFTDEGIKYISKENYENDNFIYENTNIISAKFTTACLTEDKKSFYAVSDQGTYSYDADKQNYRLTNFFYIYDPETLLIKDYGDYCDLKNLDDSAIRYENTSDIEMMESSSSGFKLIKWESDSKWVLLNKQTGTIYISNDEKFGYFTKTSYSGMKYIDTYNELLYGGKSYGTDLVKCDPSFIFGQFEKSNITSGDFYCLTVISSTVIAGNNSGNGLYYSEDNGHTWQLSNITFGYFYCLTVIGSTVIAGSNSDKGLYYSEDNGKTWQLSNITSGYFRCLTVIGSTVIAGSYFNKGLYYSEDNGHTWQLSNITSGHFSCLTVIGSTVIAGSYSGKGLYYSEDNGHTWQLSNITSDEFFCLTVIGSTVIAGSWSDEGIYYSEDNGKTWKKSNITSGHFRCLTVIGSTVIAGSWSNKGLYYSEDNGHTWQLSNITYGNFQCLTVIGSTVIAGSHLYKEGLYYSEDNGKTWNQSNITSGSFYCLTDIGSTVIAGSDSKKGLYYSDSFNLPKVYKTTAYEENTIDKFKRKIQLDSFETILDEQDLPTLESELTTPLKYYNGGLFEINGNTYIIGKDITDFVYVNGYYYALIPSGKVIYKLNKDKTLVSKITHPDWNYSSVIKLFSINNTLLIVTSRPDPFSEAQMYIFPIYTDKETIKAHPELYNDDTNKLSIITDNSKN